MQAESKIYCIHGYLHRRTGHQLEEEVLARRLLGQPKGLSLTPRGQAARPQGLGPGASKAVPARTTCAHASCRLRSSLAAAVKADDTVE